VNRKISFQPETKIETGCEILRPLIFAILLAAEGNATEAARPYTVSLGTTATPPAFKISAARDKGGGAARFRFTRRITAGTRPAYRNFFKFGSAANRSVTSFKSATRALCATKTKSPAFTTTKSETPKATTNPSPSLTTVVS